MTIQILAQLFPHIVGHKLRVKNVETYNVNDKPTKQLFYQYIGGNGNIAG